VERAARHSSLVVGAYDGQLQAGYLRVVSDLVRFAYICDVFVAEAYRGRGIATRMLDQALNDPEHADVRRWALVTQDAHALYRGHGFDSLANPERWMVLAKPPSMG